MGEAKHGGVRHPVELVAHGGVYARVAVAMNRAPERGDAVDVASTRGVDQLAALGAIDDQRLLLRPPPLLGERVPDVGAVGGHELGVIGLTMADPSYRASRNAAPAAARVRGRDRLAGR